MKPSLCILCAALVALVALTSINCVQTTTTPQPSPSPAASATPGPTSGVKLEGTEKLALYNKAAASPYVNDSIAKTAWRTTRQVGNQLIVDTSYTLGDGAYLRCHEIGPGLDRWRELPAVELVPGNGSRAGINVVAFFDGDRVAYIGYVPRPGAPVDNFTYASIDGGVDEYDRATDAHREYKNVTIVDTGYVPGMKLSQDQKDKAVQLAMTNATVRGYVDGYTPGTNSGNITVRSYETGYPDRYILAYPMVIIDVIGGGDTIYVFTDLVNDRVVRVEHGFEYKP